MILGGRRTLVTGAASGIGRASALALAAEGASVVGLDLAPPPDETFPVLSCDLRDEAQIVAGVAEAADRLGGVDILVLAAGVLQEAALGDVTAAHVDLHLSVNVRGMILTAREALPHLGEGARIIPIASELAALGRAGASVYAASKAAVVGLTRSWARELAPRVLVNAVAPGPVDTPLLGFGAMTPAQRAVETDNPLGRIGRPEEIAAAVVFLAGPGASFMTGHVLAVNGGAAMT